MFLINKYASIIDYKKFFYAILELKFDFSYGTAYTEDIEYDKSINEILLIQVHLERNIYIF